MYTKTNNIMAAQENKEVSLNLRFQAKFIIEIKARQVFTSDIKGI